MATTVYEVFEFVLDDGSIITCKPANIAVLRKGNELLANLGGIEDNDQGIRGMLDIVVLCLKRQRPDFEIEEKDEETGVITKSPNYELLEDLFDFDTVFRVIEVFLGVKLNDPKLVEAAEELARIQALEKESSGAKSS